MSLHYVLDGYNIINQDPALATAKLEEGRNRLCRLISSQRPQGSRNNAVTVVFDGRSDFSGGETTAGVRVVFSRDETADEKIKRIVAGEKNRKNTVVVSDDRELRYYVRALGARVVGVKEFLGRGGAADVIRSGIRGKKGPGTNAPKHISKSLEHQITTELRQIWLGRRKTK